MEGGQLDRIGAVSRGGWTLCNHPRVVTNGASPSLEGRTFRNVEMGDQGEASTDTRFQYHEEDGVVWARYSGGKVRLGYLVGLRTGDQMDFRYSQLNTAGETASGRCRTTITTIPDGRLRLAEDWTWETKPGSGTSVVEESPP